MLLGWAVPKQGGISSSPITSIDAFPISSLSVVMGRLFKLKTSVEVIVGLCQPRLLAKVKLLWGVRPLAFYGNQAEEDIVKGKKKERDPHSPPQALGAWRAQPTPEGHEQEEWKKSLFVFNASLPISQMGQWSCSMQFLMLQNPLADSPYVLFSAHKVLKEKKLANISSLGLYFPLGGRSHQVLK